MKRTTRFFALGLGVGAVVLLLLWWNAGVMRREQKLNSGRSAMVLTNRNDGGVNTSDSLSGVGAERTDATNTEHKTAGLRSPTLHAGETIAVGERFGPGDANPSVPTSLPSPWSEWLTNTAYYPIRPKDIPKIPPEVQRALTELARQTEDLEQKVKIFRWLALRGDGSIAPLMIETLTQKYKGKALSIGEEMNMLSIAILLGQVAAHSDEALRLLLDGSEPAYWSRDPPWRFTGSGYNPTVLAGFCIKGLMRSGSEKAKSLLDKFKSAPAGSIDPELARHIADAAFSFAQIRDLGLERALDEVLSHGDTLVRYYMEWGKTDEGKQWAQWLFEQGARGTPP